MAKNRTMQQKNMIAKKRRGEFIKEMNYCAMSFEHIDDSKRYAVIVDKDGRVDAVKREDVRIVQKLIPQITIIGYAASIADANKFYKEYIA